MKSHSSLFLGLLIVCLTLTISYIHAAPAATGKQWVLLVAGSNYYYNYRHQSDVYHAYQLFAKTGIPQSQIIVMHYDDIANSKQNPRPGTVINQPNGPNNYPGVPKDYTGEDVTPENFLKILSGQPMGPGKKTIASGPEDRIFIFFSDHGAPGLIAFPSDELYATDLIATIQKMNSNKQYKEMVFYIEACESGSMFNGLLKDEWNVYATTAANPYESSYACYESSIYNTYLADCYSVDFLVDTESKFNSLNQVTFQDQYLTLKSLVTTSHVCQYGNKNIALEPLSNFFLSNATAGERFFPISVPTSKAQKLDSRDVKEQYLIRMAPKSGEFKKQLEEYKLEQQRADVIFGSFSHSMELHKVRAKNEEMKASDHCFSPSMMNPSCMKSAVLAMKEHCGPFSEASYKYAAYLRDACTVSTPEQIAQQLKSICTVVKL